MIALLLVACTTKDTTFDSSSSGSSASQQTTPIDTAGSVPHDKPPVDSGSTTDSGYTDSAGQTDTADTAEMADTGNTGSTSATCEGNGPFLVEVDWLLEIEDVPFLTTFGLIEGQTGQTTYDTGSEVCTMSCDQPWATISLGDFNDPYSSIPLPAHIENDELAFLVLEISTGATGSVNCELVGGDGVPLDFLFIITP